MPPKRKGKGKRKGNKKGKKKDDTQLELDDKYKRTVDEIAALKDHLAMRRELTRRSKSAGLEASKKMEDADKELQEHKENQKAINADMTRQYKTMQTEMGLRIHHLETQLRKTQTQLSSTEEELRNSHEEREKIVAERDAEIMDLQMKIDSMEKAYDGVIREALDSLMRKLDDSKDKWESKASLIQVRNKQALLDFGLSPLDI